MKIIITHQSKSISFEIEENLPEHEAFEVLRAFTVSAFEDLPDPLVYSLSGVSEPFLLQDPKDWKEGLQNHFRGSVTCLTVVVPSNEADSDESDSYVHITDSGEEKPAIKAEAQIAKPAEPAKDEKADEAVIEDYDSEAELEDKQTDEEEVEAREGDAPETQPEEAAEEEASPQSLCKRVKQFIVEIGSEGLQNIAAVVYTLVTEGNVNLSDAIRTAVETSEKAANHPLTQDLLAIADVYVQKFQNQCNWHAMLAQFNIDQIVSLIPGIVEALTRSMEGHQDVELDLSPIMSQFCPLLARMQQCIPPGEERVFHADPRNPCAIFQQAREHMEAEFPNQGQVTHRGITCDGCNMSPIVGVRYKSVLHADFDLCENCEQDHNPKDPLIKIKTPVEDMELLPGLSEFRRAVGGAGRGRRCPRRGGRGRGWRHHPRRGGCRRPCGPLAQMFQNSPLAAAMRERFCQPEPAAADRRDPTRPTEAVVESALPPLQSRSPSLSPSRNAAEVPKWCAKKKAKALKKEMKKEVRAMNKKAKALKKEMKRQEKELKKEEKKLRNLKKGKKQRKLGADVVGHLDTDETSVQNAGAMVLKTWKVKNTGFANWSEDTIAIFHSGNQSLVCPGYEVIQVGALAPNDVAYIRCMLSVPEVAGAYSLTYRLSGPGGKFGERLMTKIEVAEKPAENATESIDINLGAYDSELDAARAVNALIATAMPIFNRTPEPVEVTFTSEPGKNIPKAIDLAENEESSEDSEPVVSMPKLEPSAPSEPSKQPEEKPFQFQQQKEQLKMMGFEMENETLESVLVACKGDIGQAISLLM